MKKLKIFEDFHDKELVLYHGSPYMFDKFTISKMGSGSGQQIDGWGIYLTNSKQSAEIYGKYIYEITLSKDKDLILIDFNKPIEKDIVYKIIKSVYNHYNKDFDTNKFNIYYNYIKDNSSSKIDFDDYELIQFDYSGFLFYRTLSRILGGDKNASLFLLNNDIIGLKRNISNTRIDYVIFDETIINIKNKYDN